MRRDEPIASTNIPNAIVAAPSGRAQRASRGEVGVKVVDEAEAESEG